MSLARMTISTPPDFSFWKTVNSHGWCSLPPFSIDREQQLLRIPCSLSGGSYAACTISQSDSKLHVRIGSRRQLSRRQREAVRGQLLQCLRLDEDLSEFHAEARKYRHYRWIPRLRVGRLLRAPTVFEDVVKMICTTNCSWALTEAMVGNLTNKLGTPVDSSGNAFPSPETIANVNESYLRREIRAGYRSPYLLELARRVAGGDLPLETWRTSTLPTEDLYEQVLAVKGLGPYAAGNILRLLGRYDYLALDSWVRKRFSELHRNGRKASDAVIEKHYGPFGKWKGLFFWLEMTEYWYKQEFPF
ncbi:MAG TPA: hypothetical protein VI758_09795 [Bacteroidota bacterium]